MKTHRHLPMIEPLEPRIAPATFVNPTTITYHDVDGDLVTVKLSKPLLTDLASANQIFHFDTGAFVASVTPDTTAQQLQLVDFTGISGVASGVGLTVTVKLVGNGDGFANVGRINASGIDLGVIAINGDLGSITASDRTSSAPALKSLSVYSIGQFGISTQAVGGTLDSKLSASLGALYVKRNIAGASISVEGDAPFLSEFAKIGKIVVGGSVIGTALDVTGGIGPVIIGRDFIGGDGINSGFIQSLRSIAKITIGGSVLGGSIFANNDIGAVKIGGDLIANSDNESGKIVSGMGIIATVSIGGSLIGGDGIEGFDNGLFDHQFGQIYPAASVIIHGDVLGGRGFGGGSISSEIVKIGGSVHGGGGKNTANISSFGSSGLIKIGGELVGGVGESSGALEGGDFDGDNIFVRISGSVRGGIGLDSGSIGTSSSNTFIGGSLIGGSGKYSGSVVPPVNSLVILGSVIGGAGEASAQVYGGRNTEIGGSLVGGSGAFSGLLLSGNNISSRISIGGSLIAGTAQGAGGIQSTYGGIVSSLTIKGSVIGTEGFPAVISADGFDGVVSKIAFKNVTIMGDVRYGEILVGKELDGGSGYIGSVTIGGDFIASSIVAGAQPGPNGYGIGDTLLPGGFPNVTTIASITIGGQVLGTIGGTDHYGIVAERVLSLTIGGSKISLTPGAHNDTRPLGITGDLTIHEI